MLYYKIDWPDSKEWYCKVDNVNICLGSKGCIFVAQDLIEKRDFDNYNMD